jgi:broad specificity phosphatase PhoE
MVDALPPGSRRPRIYFVRHGETDWNAAGRLLSSTDQPLNGKGETQARDVAERLSLIDFNRAISSPLQRATRTAQVILDRQVGRPPLEIDPRLVEVDFGPYEGWSDAELEADPVASARRRDGTEVPGVEPDAGVEARARAFFTTLEHTTGSTLVVGHGRMLRILLATCVLRVSPAAARRLRMRNCRPAIVEPGSHPLLLGFNVGDFGDGVAL